MAINSSRESYFPAIEKKYGQPMSYWFASMKKIAGRKYPEQIAYLKENYGFSQTHANALVMFSRGSTSSKRFATPSDYYNSIDPQQAKTIRAMFKAITTKYPQLELVIAWNQPMLRVDTHYVFGVSAAKNHILFAPWSTAVVEKFAPRLKNYKVNKKTIAVPNDWQVDAALLIAMVKARLAEK